jgi:putative membrane protein
MWVPWILLLAVLIAVVWALAKQGRRDSSGRGQDALEILKQRYARGEIDQQEFQAKKKDLSP